MNQGAYHNYEEIEIVNSFEYVVSLTEADRDVTKHIKRRLATARKK